MPHVRPLQQRAAQRRVRIPRRLRGDAVAAFFYIRERLGMDIQKYEFNNRDVRIVERDGEPWFVLVDVCTALQIKNARDTAKRLESDEVVTVALTDGDGKPHKTNIVSEPGLYHVIQTAGRSPMAAIFRRWVNHDVLPAIRKTGQYSLCDGASAVAVNFARAMNARIRWDLRLLMEHHRLTSADLVRFAQEAASVPGTIAGFDWHRWDTSEPAPADFARIRRLSADEMQSVFSLLNTK